MLETSSGHISYKYKDKMKTKFYSSKNVEPLWWRSLAQRSYTRATEAKQNAISMNHWQINGMHAVIRERNVYAMLLYV